jgi:hypothetical protein
MPRLHPILLMPLIWMTNASHELAYIIRGGDHGSCEDGLFDLGSEPKALAGLPPSNMVLLAPPTVHP